jgi:hypothetical protein
MTRREGESFNYADILVMKKTVDIPGSCLGEPKSNAPEPGANFRVKPFGFLGDGQLITAWQHIRDSIYGGRGGPESVQTTSTSTRARGDAPQTVE